MLILQKQVQASAYTILAGRRVLLRLKIEARNVEGQDRDEPPPCRGFVHTSNSPQNVPGLVLAPLVRNTRCPCTPSTSWSTAMTASVSAFVQTDSSRPGFSPSAVSGFDPSTRLAAGVTEDCSHTLFCEKNRFHLWRKIPKIVACK